MAKFNTLQFCEALNVAVSVTERRNTIPILSAVLVRFTEKDAATVCATDLDIYLSVSLPGTGAAGEVFILDDARGVARALLAAGGETVEIAHDEKGAKVRSGSLAMDLLPCGNPDDMPTLALSDTPDFTATLGAVDMEAIARCAPAISKEQTRYYLNGVFIEKASPQNGDDWAFNAVATDGHRLHMSALSWPDAAGEFSNVIIPRKVVELLLRLPDRKHPIALRQARRLYPNSEGPTLAPAPGQVLHLGATFASKYGLTVDMVAKFIDGTFPDYRRVVPLADENTRRVTLSTAPFMKAINAISAPRGAERTVAMRMALGRGKGSVGRRWDGGNGSTVALEFEGDGRDLEVGFNAFYMRALLGSIGSETVNFALNDAVGPALITTDQREGFRAILMPMRV